MEPGRFYHRTGCEDGPGRDLHRCHEPNERRLRAVFRVVGTWEEVSPESVVSTTRAG
jgi:hypothetical protein